MKGTSKKKKRKMKVSSYYYAPTDYGNFLVGEGQLFPVFTGKTNTR